MKKQLENSQQLSQENEKLKVAEAENGKKIEDIEKKLKKTEEDYKELEKDKEKIKTEAIEIIKKMKGEAVNREQFVSELNAHHSKRI